MSASGSQESIPKRQNYSRKERSLQVLSANFLKLYDGEEVGIIGLDDAARRLGVERRRMYDVVNILETVGIVARKGKSQYSWRGFEQIPRAFEELKEECLRENFNGVPFCSESNFPKDNENGGPSTGLGTDTEDNSWALFKTDSRKDKSLAQLTENFLKLFLCSDMDTILLDDAAKALPGYVDNANAFRTRVRRLYDIANVLSSINLIQKTHPRENKKPAYRWLGWREAKINEVDGGCDKKQSNKRDFGVDITNCNTKKNKVNCSIHGTPEQKSQMPTFIFKNGMKLENDDKSKLILELHPKKDSKGIVFGPFAPVMPKIQDQECQKAPIRECESLSSTYRPQYHNQALSDLFTHYMEAWKSWCLKLAAQQQSQQILIDHLG